MDAQISQLRIARQATGSGPTGVPNGGYLRARSAAVVADRYGCGGFTGQRA
jgi:hypothetical protein